MELVCPECGSEDLIGAPPAPDGRIPVTCQACGHLWHRGEARPVPKPFDSFKAAKEAFAASGVVDAGRADRVSALKADFLKTHPQQEPGVAEYWARYQAVFSEDGLGTAPPEEFHYFANSSVGAHPGNMSVFNSEWTAIGPEEGARRVREETAYLLYGPETTPLEDRLSRLLEPGGDLGMKGWKEALLTKTLCIMQPERFLPILVYTSPNGGKKELASRIWDLDLPDPDKVGWRIGRLIVWSNDVLLRLAGDGFASTQHVGEFLWMAKDRGEQLRG